MDVCDGYVTDGNTEKAPSLLAPRATRLVSVGTLRPCAAGFRYDSGTRPSIVTTMTCFTGPGGSAACTTGAAVVAGAAAGGDAQAVANATNAVRASLEQRAKTARRSTAVLISRPRHRPSDV